jgi:hypothetical protein
MVCTVSILAILIFEKFPKNYEWFCPVEKMDKSISYIE